MTYSLTPHQAVLAQFLLATLAQSQLTALALQAQFLAHQQSP
jgi:hypothetical protein